MLQNYNKRKVLKVFFENPMPKDAGFQLREISRKTSLATTSVKLYLNELITDGLVISTKHRIFTYPVYWGNINSLEFRFLKKIDTILTIRESGLIEHVGDQAMPDVIILFGSASKGEDLKESDIDLFLLCRERKLDLSF